MYTVYGMAISGNCYKLKLALTQLDQPYRWVELDILKGATKTPEFLALNPNGQVPTIVLPDGDTLVESNAILCYLADGSPLWPSDRRTKAEVLKWMFFEQYSHEPNIATVRFWVAYAGRAQELAAEIEKRKVNGYKALKVMEETLAKRPFLAGDKYTIADIALYAYTHVAHEGGYDLSAYPAVQAWLARVAAQPGYVGMN
ncbi:MAG: glutathione S-transferase family protein [Burkholderiales bacterium]|nr:glutathione S-transferase family protein [Burkholderiales bacterium]